MPTNVKKNYPIYFAIDNVDLKIDTCDGTRQLHRNRTSIYQQKLEENEVSIEHKLIKNSKHKPRNKLAYVLVCLLRMVCIIHISSVSLSLFTKSYENCFADIDNSDAEEKSKHDAVWKLLKTQSPTLKRNFLTWAVYTSLTRTSHAIKTVSMLPEVNGSPNDWESLHTVIKAADQLR